jgi:hypothetical protein
MPTPTFYKNLAKRMDGHRASFLYITGSGVVLCLVSILGPLELNLQINPIPLFCLGALMVTWGWGLFLLVLWLGPGNLDKLKAMASQRTLRGRLISLTTPVYQWAASLFLTLFFAIVTLFLAGFLLQQ